MFKKILLASDGSVTAERALRVALDLAAKYGAALDVVNVIDPLPFIYFPDGSAAAMACYLEAAEAAAKAAMASAADSAKAAGVECTCHVLREHGPAQAITEHALSQGCELIVLGSHGRRGLDAVILGSVAQKVLTLAKMPVLVVK